LALDNADLSDLALPGPCAAWTHRRRLDRASGPPGCLAPGPPLGYGPPDGPCPRTLLGLSPGPPPPRVLHFAAAAACRPGPPRRRRLGPPRTAAAAAGPGPPLDDLAWTLPGPWTRTCLECRLAWTLPGQRTCLDCQTARRLDLAWTAARTMGWTNALPGPPGAACRRLESTPGAPGPALDCHWTAWTCLDLDHGLPGPQTWTAWTTWTLDLDTWTSVCGRAARGRKRARLRPPRRLETAACLDRRLDAAWTCRLDAAWEYRRLDAWTALPGPRDRCLSSAAWACLRPRAAWMPHLPRTALDRAAAWTVPPAAHFRTWTAPWTAWTWTWTLDAWTSDQTWDAPALDRPGTCLVPGPASETLPGPASWTAWIAPETLDLAPGPFRPCLDLDLVLPGPCLDLPGLTLCCRLDRPGTLPQCCLDLRPAWTAMPETLPQVCRPWTAWTLLPAPPWNRRPASDLAAWTALPWTAFRPLCLGPRCWTAASPYPGWTCRLRPASDLAA
jgi:hypothetical protein